MTSGIPSASVVARDIAALPETREMMVVQTERANTLVPGRAQTEVTLVHVSEGTESRAWKIVAGRSLSSGASSPPPIVIDTRLAAAFGLAPGSTLRLRVIVPGEATALPAVTFQVTGIAEFLDPYGGEHLAATTSEAFERARASLNTDTADMILVASRAGVDASATAQAIGRIRPEVRAFSNDQLVTRFDETGFAYFRQISFVLSTITLGFAFLLVATLLTVSVNQRFGQVAALKALGLPRRRIAAMLMWESASLVGVGGALSLPAGWALAMQLDRILRQMPNIPDRMHFFVFEPAVAAWHIGLLAATGLAAAIYPIWIATRLPIASTLRLETIS
jgi:putative ABC transport system permease protein